MFSSQRAPRVCSGFECNCLNVSMSQPTSDVIYPPPGLAHIEMKTREAVCVVTPGVCRRIIAASPLEGV